jgi:hypothetical protein
MHMAETGGHRRWLLALGAALLLVPSGSDGPGRGAASRARRSSAPSAERAPEELVRMALRLEVGPGYERGLASAVSSEATPVVNALPLVPRLALAEPVAEPPGAALLLLSLASAAGASRGRRRCPRPHPHR